MNSTTGAAMELDDGAFPLLDSITCTDDADVAFGDADVALVTPLRDGMNLVAKEFVASQVDQPGVLVLSRLAGAAETMREALQINPFDIDGTAEILHRALGMAEPERASRIEALRRFP